MKMPPFCCVLFAACSDPSAVDARPPAVDARIDGSIDADNGPCTGGLRFFTGEVVDWDSTDSIFVGVPNVVVTARTPATTSDATSPNGRFEMCLAPAPTTLFDVTPPIGSNYWPGLLVGNTAAGGPHFGISARGIRPPRAEELGLQAAAAHLFVYIAQASNPGTISIDVSSTVRQYWNGTMWQALAEPAPALSSGALLFGNLAPGSVTVSATATSTGTGTVPLEAGKLTYVTVAN